MTTTPHSRRQIVFLRKVKTTCHEDLILYQREKFGRQIEEVYTFSDLRHGRLQAENDAVALAGEEETEHSHRRQWLVPVRESVIRIAERVSEEVARKYELSKSTWQWDGSKLQPSIGEVLPDPVIGSLEGYPVENMEFQLGWLRRAALSQGQEPALRQKTMMRLPPCEPIGDTKKSASRNP